MFKLLGQNMNKYLHITLALVLSVSFGLSAKSHPEKGEPVKPNAKRAIVAVPAQNVLERQICIFVKVALERPHSQSRTAGMQSCGSGGCNRAAAGGKDLKVDLTGC